MVSSSDAVRKTVVEAIAAQLQVPVASIGGNQSLQQLGYSSLDAMKFVGILEDTLGLHLELSVVYQFSTVDVLTAHLHSLLKSAPPTADLQAQAL